MAKVSVGWALLSKRPQSNDDYSVIAASRWPFSPEGFEKIILQYLPGDPPAGRRQAADGLPRVTFGTALTAAKEPFLGVVIQNWSNDVDGANRQIVDTRFFCFRFDDLGGLPISFTSLYQAVHGRQLPLLDEGNSLAGEPLSVELDPVEPDKLAEWVEDVGLRPAAAAAASLRDRPVAVLAGDNWPSVDDRLVVLDAVAALLPAGAKVWLHAGAWADSYRKRRPHLAFAERARDEDGRFQLGGDGRLQLGGEAEESRSPEAREYQNELERLCKARGIGEIIRHLGTLGAVRQRDQVGVPSCLASLDQAKNTLRRARGGNLRPLDVRQLLEADRLDELTEPERIELFHRFIEIAEPPDLTLLDRHWRDQLYPTLRLTARRKLWYEGGSLDSVRMYVDAAHRVGQHGLLPELLRGPENTAIVPSSRSLQVAAALVEQGDPLDEQVCRSIASVPPLTATLVMRRMTADPDDAVQWLRRFDGVAVVRGIHPVDAVQPIRAVLGPVDGPVDWQAVDVLNQSLPGAALDLVKVCRQRWPERLPDLMTGVLPWLQRSVHDLDSVRAMSPRVRQEWVTQLQHFDPQSGTQQAAVDLLCYCLGQSPKRALESAVIDQHNNIRDDYIDTFTERFRALSQEMRDRVLDGVLKNLRQGWARSSSICTEAILRFLWLIGTQDSRVVSEPLLTVVATEINSPGAKCHPTFSDPWLKELAQHHPHLMRPMLMSQLGQMRQDASILEVADLCARALAEKPNLCEQDVYDVLSTLFRSSYRPAPDEVGELLCAIAVSMHRLRVPDVLTHTHHFTRAIMHPQLGYHPVQLQHELVHAAVFGMHARVTVLKALETVPDTKVLEWLETKLNKIIPTLRDISERLRITTPSSSEWRITKAVKYPVRLVRGSARQAAGPEGPSQPHGPQQQSAPHGQH